MNMYMWLDEGGGVSVSKSRSTIVDAIFDSQLQALVTRERCNNKQSTGHLNAARFPSEWAILTY